MKIFDNLAKSLNRGMFRVKAKSPIILVALGTGSLIASGVIAAVEAYKVPKVIEKRDNKVKEIMDIDEDASEETKEIAKKEASKIVIKSWFTVGTMFAPSVALAAIGVLSVFTSYNIMRKRNLALGAAYAGLDKAFREYRKKVAEELGEDREKEIRYGLREVIEENEDGTISKSYKVDSNLMYSPYARIFDETHIGWSKSHRANVTMIRLAYQQANGLLDRHGYLFLNDVYKLLEFEPTIAGNVVGWVKTKNPEKQVGDPFVDFGISPNDIPIQSDSGRDAWILDFNVAGDITNLVFKSEY